MRTVLGRYLVLILCVMAGPTAARAQGIANTLDELRLLVRVGETVTVTDGAGLRASGRITALSPTSIALRVSGQPREWKEDEIAGISQRKADSLGNGALWGLGIGAGLATVAVLAEGDWDGHEGWAVLAVAFYGAVGTGLGVAIDALIRKDQVIYQRPDPRAARWNVSPMVSPHAHGVRVSLRF